MNESRRDHSDNYLLIAIAIFHMICIISFHSIDIPPVILMIPDYFEDDVIRCVIPVDCHPLLQMFDIK